CTATRAVVSVGTGIHVTRASATVAIPEDIAMQIHTAAPRLPLPRRTTARNQATFLLQLHLAQLPSRCRRPAPNMESNPGIRVDRWLWAVRLFKTRTQATAACAAGHVRINGLPCKAARIVRPGEVLTIRRVDITRTVRVLDVLTNRVGARLVERYLE